VNEYEGEPVRGLPGRLPAGEHIVWQGAPEWRTLARTALHTRWVAGYFGVLLAWNAASGLSGGGSLGALAFKLIMLALTGAVAVALLSTYAWLTARTTVYTLTNKRVVMRYGIAFPKAFNLPFTVIDSAGLKTDSRGVGDLPIALTQPNKIAYPLLWPHARPGRFSRPEPMLRAVPDAAVVADHLVRALTQAAREAPRPYAVGRAASEPSRVRAPVRETAAA
jgi:hypothetical protein